MNNTIINDIVRKIFERLRTGISLNGFAHGRQQMQAEKGMTVTPSDTTDLGATSAIYIGGTGDLAVEFVSGDQVVFTTVQGGSVLAIRVSKVLSTNTTATNIVALY